MAKRAELHYLRLIPPPPACRAAPPPPLCTAYHMRLRRRRRSHSCLEKQRDVGGNCGGGTAVYFVFRRAYSCLIGYLSQNRKKMSNHHLKFGKLDKAWKLFLNSGYLSQSKKIFKTYCLSSRVIHNNGNPDPLLFRYFLPALWSFSAQNSFSFCRILIAFYENCSEFGIFVRCGARDVGKSKV